MAIQYSVLHTEYSITVQSSAANELSPSGSCTVLGAEAGHTNLGRWRGLISGAVACPALLLSAIPIIRT